jgi:hypothetical protein
MPNTTCTLLLALLLLLVLLLLLLLLLLPLLPLLRSYCQGQQRSALRGGLP